MLHYLKIEFGIAPPLDNVSFIRDHAVLIVPVCLLFNGYTKIILISKYIGFEYIVCL